MPFEQYTNAADDDLIEGLQNKSLQKKRAEEALFKRHLYFIKEGMNKYSLPEEEVFDAYSDTILYAINSIGNGIFEKRSSLKTYLYRIFINKCVDLIRKKTTNKNSIHQTENITDMLLKIADNANNIIHQLIERTNSEILAVKIKELGDKCRQILTMFAEGYTDKEIAVTLNYKTADVIKTIRLRCIEKLRQAYTKNN